MYRERYNTAISIYPLCVISSDVKDMVNGRIRATIFWGCREFDDLEKFNRIDEDKKNREISFFLT